MTVTIIESEQEIKLNIQTHSCPTPQAISLPPLHTWPASLKRMTLIAGITACLGAYGLFIGGVLGVILIFLQFAFKG